MRANCPEKEQGGDRVRLTWESSMENVIWKFVASVMIMFTLTAIAYSANTTQRIIPVKPCGKQGLVDFISLLNQPQNKKITSDNSDLGLLSRTSISHFSFSKYSGFPNHENAFTSNDRDFYQLYKIKNKGAKTLYVLTYMYIDSGYSGYNFISGVYEKTSGNRLINPRNSEKVFLADPHTGSYTNFNGMGYCSGRVCYHFSRQPTARWCASPTASTPFYLVDDWIVPEKEQLNIANRQTKRIICSNGETDKISSRELAKNLTDQLKKHKIKVAWLDTDKFDLFDNTKFIDALKIIHRPQSITRIEITDIPLGASGINALADWLSDVHNIEELNLSYDSIFSEGADGLARIITNNPGLKMLNLSGNTFDKNSAQIIANAIRYAKNLKILRMSYSIYQKQAIAAVVNAINANKSVEDIDLSSLGLLNVASKEALTRLLDNKLLGDNPLRRPALLIN